MSAPFLDPYGELVRIKTMEELAPTPTSGNPVAPVASEQTELIEETANEFPLELREKVREAMRNAWVGGYNERVDEQVASEPVSFWTWWTSEPHRMKYYADDPVTIAAREAWDVASRQAAPVSSEWNDAIEAVFKLDAELQAQDIVMTPEHVRGLKREPR